MLNSVSDFTASFLFGYDIFISYSHTDARDYAARLYEQLTSLDYSCFIDKKDAPGGRPLNSSLLAALRGSKAYILIGTERSLTRNYVKLEFEEFARTGRPIIPVNVDQALSKAEILSAHPWNIIRERDLIWMEETGEALEKGLPSPEVYEGVQNLFQFTRRNVQRRRWASVAALIIGIASLLAIWQGVLATRRLKTINEEIEKAKQQKDAYDRQLGAVRSQLDSANTALSTAKTELDTTNTELNRTKDALDAAQVETETANRRRQVAEANAQRAEQQELIANQKADQARRRAQANATVLTADSTPDPLTSLLLLTELPANDEPADGMRVGRRVASTIVSSSLMRGHTGALSSVLFSPDQKQLLTASVDGTARIWTIEGRNDPVVLRGHTAKINNAVFSPNGALIATASEDGTARIWSPDQSSAARILTHAKAVRTVQFTFDNEWLVTTTEEGAAKFWKVDGTKELPLSLPGQHKVVRIWLKATGVGGLAAADDGSVWSFEMDEGNQLSTILRTIIPKEYRDSFPDNEIDKIRFSPDGSHVGIYFDKQALVQNVNNQNQAFLLSHGGLVNSIDFNQDGSRAVTASSDGTVQVWSTADGKLIKPLDTKIRFYQIDLYRKPNETQEASLLSVSNALFTHHGNQVLTFTEDGIIRLWNVESEGEPLELRGHAGADVAVFNQDDSQLVTGADDGTARVWSLVTATEPLVLSHPKPVYMSNFSRDGRLVVTATGDGVARVWSIGGKEAPIELDAHAEAVKGAVFNNAATFVLTAHNDGAARLWDLSQPRGPAVVFGGPGGKLMGAQFSPDEQRVLTWSVDGLVRIWQRDGKGEPITLPGPQGMVWQAQFSPDGRHVLTAHEDGSARVWEANDSGRFVLLGGKNGHKDAVLGATFSPDDSKVLTVSKDGTARIWRADGKGDPIVLQGAAPGQEWMESCAFSPDGTKLITTTSAGRAWVWRADGLGQPVVLRRSYDLAHIGSITSVAFSPDGKRIITSGGIDGMICIWQADGSGKPTVLQGHKGTITYARFSLDGSHVISASEDGTVRVWRTNWSDLLAYLRHLTSATLTYDQRVTLLGESEEEARKIYERTEREYGRTPLPLDWRFKSPF